MTMDDELIRNMTQHVQRLANKYAGQVFDMTNWTRVIQLAKLSGTSDETQSREKLTMKTATHDPITEEEELKGMLNRVRAAAIIESERRAKQREQREQEFAALYRQPETAEESALVERLVQADKTISRLHDEWMAKVEEALLPYREERAKLWDEFQKKGGAILYTGLALTEKGKCESYIKYGFYRNGHPKEKLPDDDQV